MHTLPENLCFERDSTILKIVEENDVDVHFASITSEIEGHRAEFFAFEDALKVRCNNCPVPLRINVSARLQQQIADRLNCHLLTPLLADLIWLQRAVTIEPMTKSLGRNGELAAQMSTTAWMIEHSARIDAALAKTGWTDGIVASVGKHWIVANELERHIGMAANYGWHFDPATYHDVKGSPCTSLLKEKTGRYVQLIQSLGTRHAPDHSDYSQTCILVADACVVDGMAASLDDVFKDPILAKLANHDGVLRITRQP